MRRTLFGMTLFYRVGAAPRSTREHGPDPLACVLGTRLKEQTYEPVPPEWQVGHSARLDTDGQECPAYG